VALEEGVPGLSMYRSTSEKEVRKTNKVDDEDLSVGVRGP
jgi:hypothetical protein